MVTIRNETIVFLMMVAVVCFIAFAAYLASGECDCQQKGLDTDNAELFINQDGDRVWLWKETSDE